MSKSRLIVDQISPAIAAIDSIASMFDDTQVQADLRDMQKQLQSISTVVNFVDESRSSTRSVVTGAAAPGKYEWRLHEEHTRVAPAKNDHVVVNGLEIRSEDGRLYVDNTDVTDFVKQSRIPAVGGYRDSAWAPAMTPVPTTWLSRLFRRFVAWLER